MLVRSRVIPVSLAGKTQVIPVRIAGVDFEPLIDIGKRYLIDELFDATYAAGLLNGLISNGTGTTAQRTRLVTDTNSKLSQTGGVLDFATGGVGVGNPGNWWGAVTRDVGRLFMGQITQAVTRGYIGWDSNQAGSPTTMPCFYFRAGSEITIYPSGIIVYGSPTGVDYKVVIILRATGAYYLLKGGVFSNWTLQPWLDLLNTTPLYPQIMAGDTVGFTSTLTSSFMRVPEDLVISRMVSLLYDTFTRANGALGSSLAAGPDGQAATARLWTAPTWTIDTNQAKNTPTLGGDMVDAGAGVFTAGTYAWVAQGANIIANVGNELQITYVNDATGAKELLAAAADAADLTIGAWYRLDWQSYVNAGSVGFDIYDGVNTFLTTEAAVALASHFQTFRSRSVAGCYIINSLMGAGEIAYLDNWTLKEITETELYAETTDISIADVILEIDLATIVAGSQLGLRCRLDSVAAPANGLWLYYDKQLGKVMLDQKLAGVWSNLFSTAKAYAANLRLIIQLIGIAVRVYCGVAGSETLVTATTCGAGLINNTLISMFSTDAGNRISRIDVRAVGSGGEYNFFNDYLP